MNGPLTHTHTPIYTLTPTYPVMPKDGRSMVPLLEATVLTVVVVVQEEAAGTLARCACRRCPSVASGASTSLDIAAKGELSPRLQPKEA